jgi:hypothetical protein
VEWWWRLTGGDVIFTLSDSKAFMRWRVDLSCDVGGSCSGLADCGDCSLWVEYVVGVSNERVESVLVIKQG